MRKLIAFIFRTFSTTCPHCHKHFYGRQPYKTHAIINKKNYRIVCHRCANL